MKGEIYTGTQALCKIITQEEYERFINALNSVVRKSDYWRLVMHFGRYIGLRRDETATFNLKYLDLATGIYRLPKQKNKDKFEPVVVPNFLIPLIKEHILKYKVSIEASGGYLFFTRTNKHQSGWMIDQIVKKTRQRANLDTSYSKRKDNEAALHVLTYHTLRHLCLTDVQDKLNDIYSTMLIGRHKSIISALRYQHTSIEQKKKITERVYSGEFQKQQEEIALLKESIKEIKDLLKSSIIQKF